MNTHTTHIETKRLERSRSDRVLAGVSGGLARYFDIHPAFFRVGFVVLTLLGGAGIVIYLASALVIPDEGQEDSFATAALRNRRDRPWPLIGLAFLAVAVSILLSRATLWPQGDAWFLFLLAGALILWITRHSTQAAPQADAPTLAKDDSRRLGRFVRVVMIIVATIVALILIAVAAFAAAFHVHVNNGIGDRQYEVAGLQDLRDDYKLGIGNMRLDLRSVDFPLGQTEVNARVDVGKLLVQVPDGVALRVHGDAQAGQVTILGRTDDGSSPDESITESGDRVLVLDAHVGAGDLVVTRSVR
jgi:phage shock protein PspC (stress-responsive transcriptional regulator)